MADSPVMGTGYLRIAGDFSQLNAQAVGLFGSSKWGKMGKAAGAALAGGLVAGGALKGLYEIGQAFDDASDKIRVTTGANEKQLARLNKSFKNVVSDVPADFDSASTAIADLNQRLGLTGKPLQKMSKQMLELSRITDTDVKTNIESVSKSFRDWEVKTKDQTSTLDAFFRLSQKSGVSVADLASQVQKFGSPLRQLGFSLDESAAMFANFERSGVNTQTMVPGLKLAISNLTRPTDELGASMEKLGVNVGKPDVALRQVFDLMSEKGLPTVEKTGLAMDVFGKRAGADMAEAIKQGRFEVDDLLKVMKDGSETIRKAGRETMDFGEQWTLLKNNVFVALEPIAKKVFGTLGDEMKRVTDILTDKDLSKDEKFTAILDRIGKLAEKYGPKIAEAGGKIGIALIKGVAGAFMDSSILGKLFIGGAALRLFGGPGVFGKLGVAIGRRMMGTMATTVAAEAATGGAVGSVFTGGKWTSLGKIAGRTMGVGMAAVAAHWFAKNFQDDISGAAADIFGGTPGENSNLLESLTGVDVGGPIRDALGLEDAGDDIQFASRRIQASLDRVQDGFAAVGNVSKKTGKDITRWRTDAIGDFDKTVNVSDRHSDKLGNDFDRVGRDADRGKESISDYAHGADKNFGKVTSESAQMQSGVSRNVGGMVNLVGKGLKIFASNTNKALQGFGAKEKISLALETVGGAAAGLQHGGIVKAQQGAWIVPGTSSGDTVPLHIGGRLAALVEPREEVSVLNRTATAAKMAFNSSVPRLAGGGVAGKGTSSGSMGAMIALANKYEQQSYPYLWGGGHGGFVNAGSPVDCSGFVSDILHAGGLLDGAPMVSGALASWGKPGKGPLTVYANDGHTLMSLNDKFAGTSASNPGGGAGWISDPGAGYLGSFAARTMDAVGGLIKEIKRLMLKGPDGPLKSLGQAGLDKGWKAANAYISKQMPSGSFGGGDIGSGTAKGINSAAEFIPFWNQINPDAQQFASAFSKIVPAESGWNPRANNGSHAGWYQFDAPTWSDFGKGGWPEGPYDPSLATAGAGNVARQEGWGGVQSRWAATYAGKQVGGIVQKLAGGGKAKGDKKKPKFDGPWSHEQMPRGVNALEAALKAQKKIGRLGRAIGMQDERIDIADRLASLDSSPAGSELSAFERNELLDLNTTLLRKLAATGALSMQGLRLTERGMKNATGSTLSRLKGLRGTFKDSYTDTLGLTGKGGRVFDTKLNLKALRNTPLGSAATAEARAALLAEQLATLSGQLGVSQGQYGVFGDYFPRFHGGGMVPGPLGQERPIVAAGGERILTPEQQQMMVEPVIYADIYVGGEKIDERVDVRLRKVAKQTARRVPTGRI